MRKKEFYLNPLTQPIVLVGETIICGSPQANKSIEGMSASDDSIDEDSWF